MSEQQTGMNLKVRQLAEAQARIEALEAEVNELKAKGYDVLRLQLQDAVGNAKWVTDRVEMTRRIEALEAECVELKRVRIVDGEWATHLEAELAAVKAERDEYSYQASLASNLPALAARNKALVETLEYIAKGGRAVYLKRLAKEALAIH